MKFIYDSGIVRGRTRTYLSAIFLCRECGEYVKRRKIDGLRQETCGCLLHGDYKSELNTKWTNMKDRCGNPNYQNYHRYGGRGIKVCGEWSKYKYFKKWAMLNGYLDHLQIDRIDNDGDYTPENCRFVTNATNSRKRSSNKLSMQKASLARSIYKTTPLSQDKVGKLFGVCQQTMWSVINKKTWFNSIKTSSKGCT